MPRDPFPASQQRLDLFVSRRKMAPSHLDPMTTVPGSKSHSVHYPEGASTLLSGEGLGPMPGEPWRITEEKEERSLDI
jgi:hypothetical protein